MSVVGCAAIDVTGITVSAENNTTTISVGDTLQYSATAYPTGASNSVTWTTSDETLATIDDNGLLTAVGVGNVNVIATSTENTSISGQASLIIQEAGASTTPPTSITINADTTELTVGETMYLTISVTPSDASTSVTWLSSNADVASVSTTGAVRALAEGTTVISATSTLDVSVYGSIIITVTAAEAPGSDVDWDSVDYTTHEELNNMTTGDVAKVKGKVLFIYEYSSESINYFIQNGSEGFFVYGQNPTYYPVEIGKVYEVGGYRGYYQGVAEIVTVEHCVELDEDIEVTLPDVSDLVISDVASVADYMSTYVTTTATLMNKDNISSSSAYNLTFSQNDQTFTVRVNNSYMSDEEFAAINAKIEEISLYQQVTINGVFSAYGYGTPSVQLWLLRADDIIASELTDAEAVAGASQALTFPYTIEANETSIDLPSTVDGYENVTVTYTSNSDAINTTTGAVTHGTTDEFVTLTATFSQGEASTSVQYYINVMSADDNWLTLVQTLDFEDAAAAGSYGTSSTKSSYDVEETDNLVTLGSPSITWQMKYALIAGASNDVFNGTLAGRAQSRSETDPGYIRTMEDVSVDVVEFKFAVFSSDTLNIQTVSVNYSTDSGETFTTAYSALNSSRTFQLVRVTLPERANRISIEFTSTSNVRANIDDIYFYTIDR